MESSGKSSDFGSSGMYIVDPEYEKKTRAKSNSKRWCLLVIILLVIVGVVCAIIGIVKATQSSETSEKSKQEKNLCYETKCTSTPSFGETKASSSMENVSPSRTSYPVTSTVHIGASSIDSSSLENMSPSRTSYPVTSTVHIVTSWSTWQAWSGCSTSCGGGIQTRNRTCGGPSMPNVIANCYGNNVLYRNCSTWKCPDCSKPCPTGHLNSACDACVCTNITVTGIVRNEAGTLLNNATIAFSESPFSILARTNIAGHFEIRGICVEHEEMIVERSGYIAQLLNAQKIDSTSFKISATLEAIVYPEVTVHPESKIRIENHTMTLCCTGTGKPTPKYEWILNGRSVSEYQQDEKESSKLVIPRTHTNMTGEVKCRVYSDYGAEFSNAAKITVITKNDSCNDTPVQQMTTLPQGCVDEETNSSVVDVGRCIDDSCFANHLVSHNCFDNYCCQSQAEKSVVIRCLAGVSFNITRITSCGCGRCSPKITTVNGVATGGPNNAPFKYGYIYSAGKYLTQSGKNGDFSFTLSGDITRVVLNFKGKDRYNDFQDLTRVVPVVPGRETFVEVRLKPRPKPMLVNTSETIEIPMGYSNSSDGESGSAPVVLSLPPQSLMTEDGEVYNGTANVEVNFADPRNATQIQEADGDFTAVSDDGDQQFLDTFGVLKIDFTDSNGKPLQARTDVDVLLDLDEYNITEKEAEDIKLWYMDENTGRWRMMDTGLKQHESRRSKRSGRKFFFGKIDHTIYNKLVNLDQLGDRCYVKIKVNDNGNSLQSSVKITVTSTQGNLNRYYDYALTTEKSECIETFCKNLTIQATRNGEVLQPNDENIDASLTDKHGIKYYRYENASHRFNNRITIQNIRPTTEGPFYKDYYSCRSTKSNTLSFNVSNKAESSSISIDLRWHQNSNFHEEGVCFVKITTEDSCRGKAVLFHVKSTNVSQNSHVEEGFTIVSTSISSRSTWAEFKCPTEARKRDVLVTVTPLLPGNFTKHGPFMSSYMTGEYELVVDHVVKFRPRFEHNDISLGIVYRSKGTKTTIKHHDEARKYCGDTTAGIIFDCAYLG